MSLIPAPLAPIVFGQPNPPAAIIEQVAPAPREAAKHTICVACGLSKHFHRAADWDEANAFTYRLDPNSGN